MYTNQGVDPISNYVVTLSFHNYFSNFLIPILGAEVTPPQNEDVNYACARVTNQAHPLYHMTLRMMHCVA